MRPYYKESYDFINSFSPVSESVFEKLYSFSELKVLKANTKFLKQGIVPNKIYLILSGVVRAYLVLDNGKEITTRLFNPTMFYGSFKALVKQQPSKIIYETLIESEVLEIDFKKFYELCKTNIEVMTLYSKVLEDIVIRSEARYVELSSTDATQRYLSLRKRIPSLDNIIPQYQIASSIGVTPVQLSRIRAKIR